MLTMNTRCAMFDAFQMREELIGVVARTNVAIEITAP